MISRNVSGEADVWRVSDDLIHALSVCVTRKDCLRHVSSSGLSGAEDDVSSDITLNTTRTSLYL
jgi:hypothetical protein